MKKKGLYIAGAAVLLGCMIAYFSPLFLSNAIGENTRIDLILNEFEIRDGEPNIASTVYDEVTAEQKAAILTLLENCTYRKTSGALFSDGSITDPDDRTLTVFIYDDRSSVASIVMASSGKIAVNDKSYHFENAGELIGQIIALMEQAG